MHNIALDTTGIGSLDILWVRLGPQPYKHLAGRPRTFDTRTPFPFHQRTEYFSIWNIQDNLIILQGQSKSDFPNDVSFWCILYVRSWPPQMA